MPPRSRTCANAILDRMPYAVGRMYVKKNFNENAKGQVPYLNYFVCLINGYRKFNV